MPNSSVLAAWFGAGVLIPFSWHLLLRSDVNFLWTDYYLIVIYDGTLLLVMAKGEGSLIFWCPVLHPQLELHSLSSHTFPSVARCTVGLAGMEGERGLVLNGLLANKFAKIFFRPKKYFLYAKDMRENRKQYKNIYQTIYPVCDGLDSFYCQSITFSFK